MVGTSKILTVSYGTFSCTLEGFEEPFSTMRSIAEYFRDLAADDRYFGAEPPTPDAEMLHRIAEREVQKRVVARVEDNGVVLRQIEDPDTPVGEGKSASSGKKKSKSKVKKDKSKANAKARALADDGPVGVIVPTAGTSVEGDSIAAKMLRIRAAVARSAAADAFIEDQHFEELYTTRPIEAAFDDIEDEEEAVEAISVDAAQETPVEEVDETEAEADEDMGSEDDAITNVMSALQMAPMAEAEREAEPVSELLDDEPAEEAEAPRGPRLVRTRLVKVAKSFVEPVADVEEDVAEEKHQAEAPAAIELHEEAETEVDEFASAAESDEFDTDEMEADEFSDITADLIKADANEEAVAEEIDEDFEAVAADDDARDDYAEDLIAARAAELSETFEADAVASLGDSDLSPEAEADLLKELAAVEAEVVEDRSAAVESKARLGTKNGQDDVSVTRILAETNSQLDDSESSRRRTTIAHLKAAVAATRADREDHADHSESDEEIDRYRDDLNRVVRPRRPGDSRPISKERRMAPLMLVSEQRIDLPTLELTGDMSGIRPRRITTGNLALLQDVDMDEDLDDEEEINLFAGDTSFTEFAHSYGAVDIDDQIEAAAAHAIFVEGRPHVSRPYLMRQVSELAESEYSREDALRAFGTLLREGRIQKLKRGQFGVSKKSRFRPDGAAAE